MFTSLKGMISMSMDCTWVVMEDDVEKVLISPGDVVLVLLIERVQKVLPRQAAGDHAVLKHRAQSLANSLQSSLLPQTHHQRRRAFAFQLSFNLCGELLELSSEGRRQV